MFVVDVGNTDTVIGFYDGQELKHHWRIQTRSGSTADELRALLMPLLAEKQLKLDNIDRTVIGSVVPAMQLPLSTVFGAGKVQFVDHKMHYSFDIALENPAQIGADRLINAEAVVQLYGKPAIVVDAGTATTFCVVEERNGKARYLGGAIAPGMTLSAQALVSRAARLVHIDTTPNPRYVGGSTEEALRSGVVNGHAAMIDGMVECILAETGFGNKVITVATGGLIGILQPLLRQIRITDPLLTLKGLRLLAEKNPPRSA